MFEKVLIVDDHDDINKSVMHILESLGVNHIHKTQYCDDAFLKMKRAELDQTKYDLLITDLSFKKDHHKVDLDSGESLIEKLRLEFPELSIIVYSMKDQLQKVRQLIKMHKINAYVCKDRKGSRELEDAIRAVAKGQRYLSPQVSGALRPRIDLEIEDYDVHLMKLLSKGLSQDEISSKFKSNNISPNSLSTIEKRLNKLRVQFKANNAIQLVATAKDLGLI